MAGATAAPLLSACGSDSGTESGAGYPIARPNQPLEMPIFDSNPPIADGLAPERGGVFKILNYDQYLHPGILKDFGEKYDVEAQVTPYNNYDEMITKLTQPGASFDFVCPGPSVMSKLVYNELVQPFNKTYIPNFANVWPEFQDPWYDLGAQYTAPCSIYSTGIGYRADRVTSIPDNGYMMLWDPQYYGKVGLLDDNLEALGMSMLANDITRDINTDNPEYIDAAKDKLIELIDLVKVKATITSYQSVPSGAFTVHQCWSGDMIGAQYYLAKGDTPEIIGYWVPEAVEDRVIGSDFFCVPKSASKPVLGHIFTNDILDNDISLRNFGWSGYQPPLDRLTGEYLMNQGMIPENLVPSAVVGPEDFKVGLTQGEFEPAVANLWLAAWQEFLSGG
jgi:spermidine/putrescine transport system substrate-binding protein